MANIILDVSRTITRLHHPFKTGIDRVETAYIDHISSRYPDSYAVAKLGNEFFFSALKTFRSLTNSADIAPKVSFQDRFRYKLSWDQRLIKSFIRREIGWRSHSNFSDWVASLPAGTRYLSVGHSRALSDQWHLFRGANCTVEIMFHDFIPLTHPDFVRSETPARFKQFLLRASQNASALIFVSDYTQEVAKQWLPNIKGIVASPGIEQTFQKRLRKGREPFVLVVGTIEPRKNYDLLARLWVNPPKAKNGTALRLKIVGQLGWASDDLVSKLNKLQKDDLLDWMKTVNDAELSDLYARCHATVFPSFVEGFGIPFYEAAASGSPIIAADIPAFRSVAGDQLKLLQSNDEHSWREAIEDPSSFHWTGKIPSWADHFRQVGL